MGGGDAGGVLVSPAPAVGFQATAMAVSGRLLEPELIALSSHGGHHLFINRIPPRLPKEDVEKIILAQLRLHPFVLQVSKCSVIPQNSLKNKGYGFITLNGSPSPSDLDAIADSLNNKLQVGCRTLGVRVCTDCHSACYVDDDGCVSSSSSTPPNEPADGDDDSSMSHAQLPATDAHPDPNYSTAAAGGDAPTLGADQPPARSSSAPPPQLELLQTAVAALAKQTSLPAGPAPGPLPAPRRRKPPGKQHDQRPNSEHGRYPQSQQQQHHHHRSQQHQQVHGLQERLVCRLAGKPQSGQGAAAHAGGRQRRHTGDGIPSAAALTDLIPGPGVAVVQRQECLIEDRAQSPAVPFDLAHPPPSPPAPAPTRVPAIAQQQQQLEAPQDGECGGNTGSPRSVTSYSSVSGSGHGSASNSAPGSVCSGAGSGSGSGSGRVSGPSAGGWCSPENGAQPRVLMGPPQPASSSAFTAVGAPADAPLLNSAGRYPPSVHQPQAQQPQAQRPPRTTPHGRGAGVCAVATSRPHPPPSASQQPAPGLGPVHQFQMPAQPSGSAAKGARSTAPGSRAGLAAAPMPAGAHGRAGRGQATAAQRVPPPPPPRTSQQPSTWNAGHASGFGRTGQAHLHSASAPPSSAGYIYQYHQHHHDHHRRAHQQQQQQRQYPPLQAGAFAPLRNDGGGGSGARDGGSGGPPASGDGGIAALAGGGGGQQRLLQHPSHPAALNAAPGCNSRGPPRPAWADGADGCATDGPGSGSCPGGPSLSGRPAHLHLPMAQCPQQQQQLQSLQQLQPQLQQQPWAAPFPISNPPNPSAQLQQQMAPAAYQQEQLPRQQQHVAGLQYAPHLRQQQQVLQAVTPPQQQQQQQHSASTVAQAQHRHQHLQQGRDGAPVIQQLAQQQGSREPQEWQQQQQPPLFQRQSLPMPYMQQQQQMPPPQQQQHTSLAKNGGDGAAGRVAHPLPRQPLSSGCLPATSLAPTSTALSLQFLMGAAGASSDAFRAGSSVPHASSLPLGLAGWRVGSLDLEYELLRGRAPEAPDPQFLAAAHVGMPLAAAIASGVSARSAELFLGRGSSDGVQEAGEESGEDSADLDPLDLEPMILQLLENDDDGNDAAGGRSGVPATVPRNGADLRNQPHNNGQLQARGEAQRPQHLAQQHHHHHQEQREQDLQRINGIRQTPLGAAAPPGLLAAPSAVLVGAAAAGPRGNHHQQRPNLHRQQPRQQPQRKQAGFETGSSMGGVAAAWAMPRARSDGSTNSSSSSSRSSAVGAFEAAVVRVSAPAPAAPPAASAPGLVGPTAALQPAGGLGPSRERPPAAAAAAVAAAAPVAVSGQRWAKARGPCGPGPGLGPGVDGSFPGADTGAFEGTGAGPGWHRRGGGSRAPAAGGGGGSSGGNGGGFRGNRHPGGGRGPGVAGGYGGGRVSGPRVGAASGGSAGAGAGAGMSFVGYHSSGGRGGGAAGGFEPHGFVSGSLPNANLLAVMQRLNE